MKYNLLIKILAIGIILLLLGVGIHPAFAVDIKKSIVNKVSEEDCDCKEIENKQLVELEKQLSKVEFYSNLLLVLLKNNPEIKEQYREIDNLFTIIKNSDSENETICNILFITSLVVMEYWGILLYILIGLEGFGHKDGILYKIIHNHYVSIEKILASLFNLFIHFNCGFLSAFNEKILLTLQN